MNTEYKILFIKHDLDCDFGYGAYKEGEYTRDEMTIQKEFAYSLTEVLDVLKYNEFSFDYDISKAVGLEIYENGKLRWST